MRNYIVFAALTGDSYPTFAIFEGKNKAEVNESLRRWNDVDQMIIIPTQTIKRKFRLEWDGTFNAKAFLSSQNTRLSGEFFDAVASTLWVHFEDFVDFSEGEKDENELTIDCEKTLRQWFEWQGITLQGNEMTDALELLDQAENAFSEVQFRIDESKANFSEEDPNEIAYQLVTATTRIEKAHDFLDRHPETKIKLSATTRFVMRLQRETLRRYREYQAWVKERTEIQRKADEERKERNKMYSLIENTLDAYCDLQIRIHESYSDFAAVDLQDMIDGVHLCSLDYLTLEEYARDHKELAKRLSSPLRQLKELKDDTIEMFYEFNKWYQDEACKRANETDPN